MCFFSQLRGTGWLKAWTLQDAGKAENYVWKNFLDPSGQGKKVPRLKIDFLGGGQDEGGNFPGVPETRNDKGRIK